MRVGETERKKEYPQWSRGECALSVWEVGAWYTGQRRRRPCFPSFRNLLPPPPVLSFLLYQYQSTRRRATEGESGGNPRGIAFSKPPGGACLVIIILFFLAKDMTSHSEETFGPCRRHYHYRHHVYASPPEVAERSTARERTKGGPNHGAITRDNIQIGRAWLRTDDFEQGMYGVTLDEWTRLILLGGGGGTQQGLDQDLHAAQVGSTENRN